MYEEPSDYVEVAQPSTVPKKRSGFTLQLALKIHVLGRALVEATGHELGNRPKGRDGWVVTQQAAVQQLVNGHRSGTGRTQVLLTMGL